MVIIAFFGVNTAAEKSTEQRLARADSSALKATGATFDALARWHDALEADARGDAESATDSFDEVLVKAREARSKWKRAEFEQQRLIEHLVSLDEDVSVRPEVREQIADQSPQDVIERAQSRGMLADVQVEGVTDLAEYGRDLLGLEEIRSRPLSAGSRDDGMHEIMDLFQVDLRARMLLKSRVRDLVCALEDAKAQVEEGRLFESVEYTTHTGDGWYSFIQRSGEVRSALQSYELFRAMSGNYMTGAVAEAPEEIWPELERYAERDAAEPGVSGPSITASSQQAALGDD